MQEEIINILYILRKNGKEGRLVGGYVRDYLLGKQSNDVDIATIATPEEVCDIFLKEGLKVIPTGLKHGTVTVVGKNNNFELTTLREDISTDGRHADVCFSKSWEKDASRRDFTFNAIYMDLEKNLYDFFGGIEDLKNKIIKFIGDPETRINEDYLRILRYYRLKLQLGCVNNSAPQLISIFQRNAHKLAMLSKERIREEFFKILSYPNSFLTLQEMMASNVLENIVTIDNKVINEISAALIQNSNITLDLFNALQTISKVLLISDDSQIVAKMRSTKDEKKKIKFLQTEIKFNVTSKNDIIKNLLFYADLFVLDKIAFDILKNNISVDSRLIEQLLSLMLSCKEVEATYLMLQMPLRSSDLVKLGIPYIELSKQLELARFFWSASLGKASKEKCLSYLCTRKKNVIKSTS